MAKQKETRKQRETRLANQARKEEERIAREQRRATLKKVGIAVVCVIFALALALPTVALSVLSHS